MGSRWKMPTYDQSQEMLNGTNRTWTTMNGVNGYKFTSKIDSSKYIFLPAGGFYDGDTTLYHQNSIGYYWISTLRYTSSPWSIYFNSSNQSLASNTVFRGTSVRAIQINTLKNI